MSFDATFETRLREYAILLIRYGVNIQPGQCLYINAEAYHRDFVLMIVEEAYRFGAKYVEVDFYDNRIVKPRTQCLTDKELDFVPEWITQQAEEMVRDNWAYLRLEGFEYPEYHKDTDLARLNRITQVIIEARKSYNKLKTRLDVQWCIGAAATPNWARQAMTGPLSHNRFWEEIFKIVRVTGDGTSIDKWEEHDAKLRARAKFLNNLKIKGLNFTGPGTQVLVYLKEQDLLEVENKRPEVFGLNETFRPRRFLQHRTGEQLTGMYS